MHSLLHVDHARAVAADRVRPRSTRSAEPQRWQPPPLRPRLAVAVARVATRLDRDAARRAVA